MPDIPSPISKIGFFLGGPLAIGLAATLAPGVRESIWPTDYQVSATETCLIAATGIHIDTLKNPTQWNVGDKPIVWRARGDKNEPFQVRLMRHLGDIETRVFVFSDSKPDDNSVDIVVRYDRIVLTVMLDKNIRPSMQEVATYHNQATYYGIDYSDNKTPFAPLTNPDQRLKIINHNALRCLAAQL